MDEFMVLFKWLISQWWFWVTGIIFLFFVVVRVGGEF